MAGKKGIRGAQGYPPIPPRREEGDSTEAEIRRSRVEELLACGLTATKIAIVLQVGRRVVQKDVALLSRRLKEQQLISTERRRAIAEAKLEHAYQEALRAWYASWGQKTETTVSETEEGPETKTKTWHDTGDPRYLGDVFEHIRQMRQLYAIDVQPTTIEGVRELPNGRFVVDSAQQAFAQEVVDAGGIVYALNAEDTEDEPTNGNGNGNGSKAKGQTLPPPETGGNGNGAE